MKLTLNRAPKAQEPSKPSETNPNPIPDSLETLGFSALLDQQIEKAQSNEAREKATDSEESMEQEEVSNSSDAALLLAMSLLSAPASSVKPPPVVKGETDSLLALAKKPEAVPSPIPNHQHTKLEPGFALPGWIAVQPQVLPLSILNSATQQVSNALGASFESKPLTPFATNTIPSMEAMLKEPLTNLFPNLAVAKSIPNPAEKPLAILNAITPALNVEGMPSNEAQAFEGSYESREEASDQGLEGLAHKVKHNIEKANSYSDSFSLVEQRRLSEKLSEVTSSPLERTIDMDKAEVIDQVTKHLENMRLLSGKGEMAFHLRPDHLGDIHIRVTSNSEGVIAHILTENHPVQQALEEAKERLRQSLEQRGLNLIRFDVTLAQGGMPERQFASSNSQTPSQNRTPGRVTPRPTRLEGVAENSLREGKSLRTVWEESLSRLDYSA